MRVDTWLESQQLSGCEMCLRVVAAGEETPHWISSGSGRRFNRWNNTTRLYAATRANASTERHHICNASVMTTETIRAMLDLDPTVLAAIVKGAQRTVAASRPDGALAIGFAAEQLTHSPHITPLDSGVLRVCCGDQTCTVTSESCPCKRSRRFRSCEHRLMAWVHQLYTEALWDRPHEMLSNWQRRARLERRFG
jgi:hypothetical protein